MDRSSKFIIHQVQREGVVDSSRYRQLTVTTSDYCSTVPVSLATRTRTDEEERKDEAARAGGTMHACMGGWAGAGGGIRIRRALTANSTGACVMRMPRSLSLSASRARRRSGDGARILFDSDFCTALGLLQFQLPGSSYSC